MNIDNYIAERVENQINWYDKKSKAYKVYPVLFKFVIILLSAAIPFLVRYIDSDPELIKNLIFIFGLVITVLTGISSFLKINEKWYSYRTTCEILKHHKFLFLTESGSYKSNSDKDNEFVMRIERTISKENSEWSLIQDEK